MFKNKSFASDAPETELGLRSAGGETPPLRFQKCKITIKTCLNDPKAICVLGRKIFYHN